MPNGLGKANRYHSEGPAGSTSTASRRRLSCNSERSVPGIGSLPASVATLAASAAVAHPATHAAGILNHTPRPRHTGLNFATFPLRLTTAGGARVFLFGGNHAV